MIAEANSAWCLEVCLHHKITRLSSTVIQETLQGIFSLQLKSIIPFFCDYDYYYHGYQNTITMTITVLTTVEPSNSGHTLGPSILFFYPASECHLNWRVLLYSGHRKPLSFVERLYPFRRGIY